MAEEKIEQPKPEKPVMEMTDQELYATVASRIKTTQERKDFGHQVLMRMIIERMCRGPKDARILVCLPGNAADIAPKVNMSVEEVEARLAVLGEKALAFKSRKGWNVPRHATQFHDGCLTNAKFDAEYGDEFFSLWEAFTTFEYHNQWRPAPQTYAEMGSRVIPDKRALAEGIELAPYEDMKSIMEVLAEQGPIGMMMCSCKRAKPEGDPTAEDPWTCVIWGRSYEWNNARGTAKTYTPDEMVDVIQKIHESGQISRAPNSKNFAALRGAAQLLCQCHPNHCGFVNPPSELGAFYSTAPSRYLMKVKSTENCRSCQSCVKMCLFKAAQLKMDPYTHEFKAWVDKDRCRGCGNCALVCPIKNRELVLARPADHVPDKDLTLTMTV